MVSDTFVVFILSIVFVLGLLQYEYNIYEGLRHYLTKESNLKVTIPNFVQKRRGVFANMNDTITLNLFVLSEQSSSNSDQMKKRKVGANQSTKQNFSLVSNFERSDKTAMTKAPGITQVTENLQGTSNKLIQPTKQPEIVQEVEPSPKTASKGKITNKEEVIHFFLLELSIKGVFPGDCTLKGPGDITDYFDVPEIKKMYKDDELRAFAKTLIKFIEQIQGSFGILDDTNIKLKSSEITISGLFHCKNEDVKNFVLPFLSFKSYNFDVFELIFCNQNSQILVCDECNFPIAMNLNQCENCGEEIQTCVICYEKPTLDRELLITSCCRHLIHKDEFLSWKKNTGQCIVCKQGLITTPSVKLSTPYIH